MAHPAEIENLPLVNTLLSTIPFDGIEVYHPSADEKMQKCFLQMAQKYKLLVSGGSDFHGTLKAGLELGCGYGNLFVPDF